MKSPDNEYDLCEYEGCPNKVKAHVWGRTKASDWFFTKDGQAFCPDHIPGWVAAWRKRKT